ncbi:hypothetical protein FZO89_09700 [Luteimonas viscosa]|uniref:Uncharacterized protein n=1 Tax=Luteimonas viscosa TaxID=1132694 RepID=A0A5D4XPJ9_9GAMM|nr:hypothetical protein [Luteimonas viscosa]TYT26509.1 hypothetical protein FZO89_09700 [Luteimonas viscosa]
MPVPSLLTRKRRLYALLAAVSGLLLLLALLPWPGIDRADPVLKLVLAISAGGLATALMLWWAPSLLDIYPREKVWRILLEGVPPLALYMWTVDRWPAVLAQTPAGAMRIAIACAPILLVLWACIAFVRYVRMLDELQQRVELVSVSLAAGLLCLLAAAAGILHAAGMLQIAGHAALWAFPVLAVAYSLIRVALTRRYE